MRVGRVLEVQPFPKARDPSWKVRVDLGPLGEKWSSAQITSYTAGAVDRYAGGLRLQLFAARNIAGLHAEVLILGAADADGKVILLSPRSDVAPGERILLRRCCRSVSPALLTSANSWIRSTPCSSGCGST